MFIKYAHTMSCKLDHGSFHFECSVSTDDPNVVKQFVDRMDRAFEEHKIFNDVLHKKDRP